MKPPKLESQEQTAEQETPKVEIRNRWSKEVIRTIEAASLVQADLRGADLREADLRGADLREADLREADLREADLREADLREANLWGADLREADLRGAKINWQSHALLAEILRQAARSDIEKRKVAGLILVSPDLCWPQFLALKDPLTDWALDTLAEYVTEGDNAPKEVRARVKTDGEVTR